MSSEIIEYYLNKEQNNIINDLKEIIAIPSVSEKGTKEKPFGENCAKVLDLFLNKAKNMGFITHNFENYAGTIELNSNFPELGILCHLDVVDANPKEWTTPPYEADVRDGKIYGRGAIDDKGPAIGVLYALKIIKESGIKLKKNVRFIVGCDEENGSSDMEYYKKCQKFPPYVFTPDGDFPVINFEKGMLRVKFFKELGKTNIIEIKGGDIINAVPSYAYAKIKNGDIIEYKGKEAHASTPEKGENALTGLIEKIVMSDIDDNPIWKDLNNIFKHKDVNGMSMGIYSDDVETGKTTCVWSKANINDGKIIGYFDVRFPKNVILNEIVEKIKSRFNEIDIDTDFILKEDYHLVPSSSSFVQKLLEVYKEETLEEGKAIAIGGGTYVHDIEGGVAFGAEFPGDNNNMHSRDESITIEKLNKNIKLYIGAIIKICG